MRLVKNIVVRLHAMLRKHGSQMIDHLLHRDRSAVFRHVDRIHVDLIAIGAADDQMLLTRLTAKDIISRIVEVHDDLLATVLILCPFGKQFRPDTQVIKSDFEHRRCILSKDVHIDIHDSSAVLIGIRFMPARSSLITHLRKREMLLRLCHYR